MKLTLAFTILVITLNVSVGAPAKLRSSRSLADDTHFLCGEKIYCLTNHSTCEVANDSGEPFCRCIDGWGGKNCEKAIDECTMSFPCVDGNTNTSFCVDYFPPQKYKCGCRSGYAAILPAQSDVKDPVPAAWRPIECLELNDCSDSPCHQNATCTNMPGEGNFLCACSGDLVGDGIKSCTVTPPPTLSPVTAAPTAPPGFCQTGLDCKGTNFECVDSLCTCKQGFAQVGPNCQDEQECAPGYPNDCHRYAECQNTVGSYTCKCNDGFQESNPVTPDNPAGRACVQTNECLELTDDCNATLEVCVDRWPPVKWECVERTPSPTPQPTKAPRPPPPPPTTPAPVIPVCFSGDASVLVKNIGRVAMRDLQVGDLIRLGNGKYQPIYSFGHQDHDSTGTFTHLHTNATSDALEISSRHFLFLHEHQEYPVLPSSLKIGDVLLGENHEPLRITKIEIVKSKGIFSPLTADGTIVVDGIVCSTYTFELGEGVESDYFRLGGYKIMTMQAFTHMWFSPVRLASLGISRWLGKLTNAEGTAYYLVLILQACGWAMSTNPIIKAVGNALYFALLGVSLVSHAAELMVGATMGPALLLVVFIATNRLCRLKNCGQKVVLDHVEKKNQ